jgi:TAP-like protein
LEAWFAHCLGWPNITDYSAETFYADNFPCKLASQMLVIGVTDDPVCPYPGELETYELIGNVNAVFSIYEVMGHCSITDPNNCTEDVITTVVISSTVSFTLSKIF